MKGSKCIKFLTFSIISMLCCVIFSNDTNAIDLTIDAEPTGYSVYSQNVQCTYADGTVITRPTTCLNPNPETQGSRYNLTAIKTSTYINATEGYYYRTFLQLKSLSEYNQILWRVETNTSFWQVISFKEVSYDTIVNSGEYIDSTSQNPDEFAFGIDRYAKFYEIILKSKNTGNNRFTFGNGTNAFIYSPVFPSEEVYVSFSHIDEFKPSGAEAMNEKDDEDRDNIESQSSENQSEADEQGGEADQAGQTLMQAFGSLITALTSVHETSCTLPNMSIYSLDLNNIDLCAVSLPSGIAALVGIGMVLIIVPLGIHLVKRMINLYKEIVG